MGKWDKYKKKDKVKKDGETVDTPNKTQKAIANCEKPNYINIHLSH